MTARYELALWERDAIYGAAACRAEMAQLRRLWEFDRRMMSRTLTTWTDKPKECP